MRWNLNVKKKIKKRKRKGFEIKTKCELFRFIYIATNAMKFECLKVRKVKKKRYIGTNVVKIWRFEGCKEEKEMWIIYIATDAMKFECSKVKKKRYRDECS